MRTLSLRMLFLISVLAILASACGKDDGGGAKGGGPNLQAEESAEETSPSTAEEEVSTIATDGSNIDGQYLATFTTLNPQVNGTLPGSATFFRKEDKLFIYLRLFAGAPQVWHQQKVYTGTRCPTIADDKNGDGHIDILEAEAVLGNILIPLDADPSAQNRGRNFYPVGDLSGSYHYERVVSFKRFFEDLKEADKNPEDNIVKLAPDEPLTIEGKAVLIQGTADTIVYPETVGTTNRYRPFQTLPIACGTFKKVTTFPGTPDDGVIPGPVADVEEGQDRPAPDEPQTSGGTGGSGSGSAGGGSNESEREESETRDENGNVRTGGDPETDDPMEI